MSAHPVPQLQNRPLGEEEPQTSTKTAAIAWLVAAVFYFYQYTLRSAPSVMMPQLAEAFNVTALGLASIVGLFYYGYAPFSLIAGAALDEIGPRKTMPFAAAVIGIGALLFATGNSQAASLGRFLQGIGAAFAAVGAIFIASRNFPASKAATLIGATQMFGMAGGSVGQFGVGPLIGRGIGWNRLWATVGVAGLGMAGLLFVLLPKTGKRVQTGMGLKSSAGPFLIVFRNPQSILCGLIAGLLFIPTTIFDMIWGVRYLQDAHGLEYAAAVMRSATVPLGWIIGCPLLGFISDRIGRRKPVILGGAGLLVICLASILFGRIGMLPPYTIGLVAGIASGAAMLPYTVIKEANPPEFSGTATGVINFLNFLFSALLGPVFGWILSRLSAGATQMQGSYYQIAFAPMLLGVVVAMGLTLLLKETGAAAPAKPSLLR